jgi:hypothetical protein
MIPMDPAHLLWLLLSRYGFSFDDVLEMSPAEQVSWVQVLSQASE